MGEKKFSLILPWSIYLLLLFIILSMVSFGTYFFALYSPMVHFFRGGGCKDVPATSATSYLVPLFTLVYIVLFHLLLPYNLDVPSYFTNRLRYCAAWPERDRTLYNPAANNLLAAVPLLPVPHLRLLWPLCYKLRLASTNIVENSRPEMTFVGLIHSTAHPQSCTGPCILQL